MSTQSRKYGAAGGMTLALYFVLSLFMGMHLEHAGGLGATLALAGLFAAVFGGALAAFVRLKKPGMGELLFTGGFMAMMMLARVAMLDFVTADYSSFLVHWVAAFREGGFKMLAENVGDYNLLYQYALLIFAKTPLHDLYLIKLLTVIFDYALALVMMCAAQAFANERAGLPALCLTLALPTVLTGGALWGQCDSVYVFFIVLSLYLLETNRPMRSAASLAIAFAFKLQTIFFFPVVLLGLIHKRFNWKHALTFFAAYMVTLVPALIAGRTLLSAVSVYANQSLGQYYDRLSYNAPNLYLFFPMMEFASSQEFTWMRYIPGIDGKGTNPFLTEPMMVALQNASLYACVILALVAVIYWLMHAQEITPDMTLGFALFFAIFLPFVMPKIHERYFFLADMLSVLYAARYKNRRFMPLLVAGASFMSYVPYLMRQRPIDERWLALMMLLALVIVARDLLGQMKENRALYKGVQA
ncbi:MAG: DUF2029 domain-containing protein [Clostridia bacterium]|nr:DUF2029 domain-containing protein [Clostridia bacterium]